MTKVRFFGDGKKITGFHVAGHSTTNQNDLDGKLLCSAVSSAVYMTANTLTEVVGAKCDIAVNDGDFKLLLTDTSKEAQTVLSGFMLHMKQLEDQYGNNIKVILEV